MEFGWINVFGAVFVILMLIPNIVYAIKNKGEKNYCTNQFMNIIEQIGRYACIVLMWLPLFVWKFGFASVFEMVLYTAGNGILLAAYWIAFAVYMKRRSRGLALVLAILPACIFFLSGIILRHWMLVGFAVLFAVGHIFVTEKNAEQACPHMKEFTFITLRDDPALKEIAAEWFHSKWGIPKEAYLECMDSYLKNETEYGWYLCLDGDKIVGGMGVIENDFHDRKDLSPNVCAVYTEEEYRCKGIAGHLLNMTVNDLRSKGITPVYLVTDHTGFYERYGWQFLCMVQGDGEAEMTRMYIHR